MFIPGLQLSRLFYSEVIKPLLDAEFPGLRYAAALIGSGSEVLGYDTEMSTDHHWGPRLLLFLGETEYAALRDPLHRLFSHKLPYEFLGYSTNFGAPIFEDGDHGTQLLERIQSGAVNHRIEIFTLRAFMQMALVWDMDQPLTPQDWLTFPQHRLLAITAGAVYHDVLGLQALREQLAYYPPDVWRYLLAAGWQRIAQEEHLMPRAGFVGDELGSSLIAARLVRDIMHLCFLMERQYAPYAKWFGTAFAALRCAPDFLPALAQVNQAGTWQTREQHLSLAYEKLAQMHNALRLTPPIPEQVSPFHGRPFQVIHAWRFAEALRATLTDPVVLQIAQHTMIGSIDQLSDNTDLLENPSLRITLKRLYE